LTEPKGSTRELRIMKILNHKHIIKLNDYFEDKDRLILVLEYALCDLGDFIDPQRAYTETLSRTIMTSLMSAVLYLHSQDIVHRDIKPWNILMTSHTDYSEIRLCDFGTATSCGDDDILTSWAGSLQFMAPEIINRKRLKSLKHKINRLRNRYGKAVDIWSLGVTLYWLLSHVVPFPVDRVKAMEKIWNCDYSFDVENEQRVATFSKDARDLIHRMLRHKCDRITLKQMSSHTWMAP
jgi:serine/threonine protein kinase